jgi:ABC-type transport system involved in multi-copper enzyme maturation permease subunit
MTASKTNLSRFLAPLGLFGSVFGAIGIWIFSVYSKLSPGVLIMAETAWLILFAVIARDAIRNLFGPVFWYEIIRLGRRRSTFLLRGFYIAILCTIFALMYCFWQSAISRDSQSDIISPFKLAEFATTVFNTFAILQYLIVLIFTPAYVAGSITDEKERKTIDYLFATDLANREIIFGKLAARIAAVILYILAGLPMIAFLQLFGGIDPDLVLGSTATCIVTAIGLAALSISFSVAAKRSRDAILISYFVLFIYLAFTFFLELFLGFAPRNTFTFDLFGWNLSLSDLSNWLATGNAFWIFPFATNGFRDFDPAVLLSMLRNYTIFWGVITLLAISWAILMLKRIALRQSYGVTRAKKERLNRWFRARSIRNSPWVWKEVFANQTRPTITKRLYQLLIICAVFVWPIYYVFASILNPYSMIRLLQWDDFLDYINIWIRISTGILTAMICFSVALRGSSAIAQEKDRNTWVSLCVSPVTVGELLYAKWLGAILQSRFLLGLLAVIWLIGIFTTAVYSFFLPIFVVFLFLFASAFSLVGIRCSVTARTALVSSIRTFFAALFMVGGFWILPIFGCILPFSSIRFNTFFDDMIVIILCITPPILTGLLPVGDFDKTFGPRGPGTLSSNHSLGMIAPFISFGFWVGINFLLMMTVRTRLTREMNRGVPRRPVDLRPIDQPRTKTKPVE